jgi:hypothetical protein
MNNKISFKNVIQELSRKDKETIISNYVKRRLKEYIENIKESEREELLESVVNEIMSMDEENLGKIINKEIEQDGEFNFRAEKRQPV